MKNVKIKNGNRIVPAVITSPSGEGPFPAVVMNHGHGGSKDEHGGFVKIAEALYKKGILTIRMDFPGCGDSTEPFTENCLSNMISDSNASLQYILDNYNVDKERIGILGYSMGGRVTLNIVSEIDSPYKSVGLLAPSVDPGEELIIYMVGGEDNYKVFSEELLSNSEIESFQSPIREDQILSRKWLDEMMKSYPLENINNFKGDMFLIYGGSDEVVPRSVTKRLADAYPKTKEVAIEDADHSFGFWGEEVSTAIEVADFFSGFFEKTLK